MSIVRQLSKLRSLAPLRSVWLAVAVELLVTLVFATFLSVLRLWMCEAGEKVATLDTCAWLQLKEPTEAARDPVRSVPPCPIFLELHLSSSAMTSLVAILDLKGKVCALRSLL